MIIIFLFVFLLTLGIAADSMAYIDPGTTGYVYNMLAPIVAFLGAIIAFVLRPIRHFFFSLFSRKKNNTDEDSK